MFYEDDLMRNNVKNSLVYIILIRVIMGKDGGVVKPFKQFKSQLIFSIESGILK